MFRDPKEREAFYMFIDNFSFDEISEKLKVNKYTVKNWAYEGRSDNPPWNIFFSEKSCKQYFQDKFNEKDKRDILKEIKNIILYSLRSKALNILLEDDPALIDSLSSLWSLYRELEAFRKEDETLKDVTKDFDELFDLVSDVPLDDDLNEGDKIDILESDGDNLVGDVSLANKKFFEALEKIENDD